MRHALQGDPSGQKFAKGDVLFAQGDLCECAFLIETGAVKISVLSPQGKEAVIAVLGTGQFCGEGCVIGSHVHLGTATALIPCTALRFGGAELTSLLEGDRSFAKLFLRHLVSRTQRLESDLVDQIFNPSEMRLARVLLMLTDNAEADAVLDHIGQQTLADMIGTTRPRISLFLSRFRKLGAVEGNGRLRVNRVRLSAMLEGFA